MNQAYYGDDLVRTLTFFTGCSQDTSSTFEAEANLPGVSCPLKAHSCEMSHASFPECTSHPITRDPVSPTESRQGTQVTVRVGHVRQEGERKARWQCLPKSAECPCLHSLALNGPRVSLCSGTCLSCTVSVSAPRLVCWPPCLCQTMPLSSTSTGS